MTLTQLIERFSLKVLCGAETDAPVNGCYIGDLLSRVMGQAQKGNVWLTIMSGINVCAVASLTEVACVVLCEGVEPDAALLAAAKQHGVTLVQTDRSAYALAAAFAAAGI